MLCVNAGINHGNPDLRQLRFFVSEPFAECIRADLRCPADCGLRIRPKRLYLRSRQNPVAVCITDIRILLICLKCQICLPLRAVLDHIQIAVTAGKQSSAVQFRLLRGFDDQSCSLKRKADRDVTVFFGDFAADLLCCLLRRERMRPVCCNDKGTVPDAAICVCLSDGLPVPVKLLLVFRIPQRAERCGRFLCLTDFFRECAQCIRIRQIRPDKRHMIFKTV